MDQKLPERDIRVRADPEGIRIVLENLISNAVQYTPRGGVLSMFAERFSSGMARLGVHNSGRGMSIGAFVRLMGAIKIPEHVPADPGEGLGLGLLLCRKIVEGHGGRLWLETDGQGATAFLTLPTTTKK